MNEEQLIALDKELAELLGWTNIKYEPCEVVRDAMNFHGTPPVPTGFLEDVPRWTKDNAAAFELMCEHEIDVVWSKTYLITTWQQNDRYKFLSDLERMYNQQALHVSIVQAVIAKLKAQK